MLGGSGVGHWCGHLVGTGMYTVNMCNLCQAWSKRTVHTRHRPARPLNTAERMVVAYWKNKLCAGRVYCMPKSIFEGVVTNEDDRDGAPAMRELTELVEVVSGISGSEFQFSNMAQYQFFKVVNLFPERRKVLSATHQVSDPTRINILRCEVTGSDEATHRKKLKPQTQPKIFDTRRVKTNNGSQKIK